MRKDTIMPPKKPATTGATKGTSSKPAAKTGTAKATKPAKPATASKDSEKKEEVKVKKVLPVETIGLKEIAKVLGYIGDVGLKVQASKRWPFLMDRNGNVGTFLKYRDTNIIVATAPTDCQPETIRLSLMGALRFGKPHILFIESSEKNPDVDVIKTLETVKAVYEQLSPGLYAEILDQSITSADKCSKLYRSSDEDEYREDYNYRTEGFRFVILTDKEPPTQAYEDFFPIIIE